MLKMVEPPNTEVAIGKKDDMCVCVCVCVHIHTCIGLGEYLNVRADEWGLFIDLDSREMIMPFSKIINQNKKALLFFPNFFTAFCLFHRG